MWVSDKVVSLFTIAKETVDDLRTQLAVANSEKQLLDREVIALKANVEWMRHKINTLEIERASLLEGRGIKLPLVPEIASTVKKNLRVEDVLSTMNFEHIDDETAKRLGIEHLLS